MRAELEDHLEHEHGVVFLPAEQASAPATPAQPDEARMGRMTIPVDPNHGATTALDVGVDIARAARFEVEVVAAVPPGLSEITTDAFLRRRAAEAAARGAGPVLRSTLASGHTARLLAEHLRADSTMVALATRGRGPVGETVLGSVSEELMRISPVPLLMVGPDGEASSAGYDRIVVALDGSPTAERVLPDAELLAGLLGAEVVLMELLDSSASSPEEAETTYLARLAEGLQLPEGRVSWQTLQGRNPADAILEVADRKPGTIIAMGTHGRTPLRRLTKGSVAVDVVRRALGPVLLPAGSPTGAAEDDDTE
jgi:nucleotide-binding universal stress UspA family protein